ncbi:cyclase family protein [Thalassobacillus sp. C254]|uniref:cyclase family protein n=1 Tax=Thalassobacillus sp. C254 TaxID=1225341 RepID=UPI000B2E771E|nr:cyclase family protein [Thalassobacillus sp. C254]
MAEKIIDLTLEIDDNIPSHKLFQAPIIVPHLTHEKTQDFGLGVDGDTMTFATSYIGTLDHIGTHVDAYSHVNPEGETIENMPMEMFMGKAVCLDLTHIPDLGEIDVSDLEEAEEKAGVKIDGHIVLLNTGLHNRHYPDKKVCWSNPGLTAEATHWLADRNSQLHGVEGPSTDLPSNNLFPSHRVCRDRGISHYEWLVNLEQLVGKGEFMFYGLPLKFKNGSGPQFELML